MEVMEDGNLMDKVHILIQRDLRYYTNKHCVLQESLCRSVVGGKLDFPRSASFAAVKLVIWWEEEFEAAFQKPSGILRPQKSVTAATASDANINIIKTSDPRKFVDVVEKSAGELLHHLHVLTQEALDHADLQVLTGTIGAAALIANCLWCFGQVQPDDGGVLSHTQKMYQAMGEALAERLLDLHTRLISLYIQQDADCLNWESERSFCESEHGSYVVQMWWMYMQGAMRDLWTSVPPKMAQRVFAGILNDSLSVFAARYTHAMPTKARAQLYAVDVSNLLLCVAELLPSICRTGDEWLGIKLPTSPRLLRDIHAKCLELLVCLLLRCSDLQILYKVLTRGVDTLAILSARRTDQPSPWIHFANRCLYPDAFSSANSGVYAELVVLVAQPQPDWAQLLKVVCMEKGMVAKLLLQAAASARECAVKPAFESQQPSCGAFLCAQDGTCRDDVCRRFEDVIHAIIYIILALGNNDDFHMLLFDFITNDCGANWVDAFDKRHVWSLNRPAWYEAIVDAVQPLLPAVTDIVINATQTGASMYQASAIVLTSCAQLWDVVGSQLHAICTLLEDVLPTNIVPLGKSALLQVVVSAVYAALLHRHKHVAFAGDDPKADVALAIAENLCSIDEDNKHTEEIQALLQQAEAKRRESNDLAHAGLARIAQNDIDIATMILHQFIDNNSEWLRGKLQGKVTALVPPDASANKKHINLLHTMFFIGDKPFDELLAQKWRPNWQQLFSQSMGLSVERVSQHIALRWDLKCAEHAEIASDIQRILRSSSASC